MILSVMESRANSPLIAIVGNPNAGKTSLFNALTGSSQKVGNYPGVTVERVTGTLKTEHSRLDILDVPGLYSLNAVSEDEIVAKDALMGLVDGRKPSLLVCVIDAGNLERNLFFFSQILELNIPIVVALTMTDLLAAKGSSVDLIKLSNLLGVEVVPVITHKRRGLDELVAAIERNLIEPKVASRDLGFPDALEAKAALLRERCARSGLDFGTGEIRLALLDPERKFEERIEDFADLREAFDLARRELVELGYTTPTLDLETRYQWASMIHRATITQESGKAPVSWSDRLDILLTHRVFGLIVFLGVMYVVFQSIYTFAGPLMTLIEDVFGRIGEEAGKPLEPWPIAQSLVVDGVINGVGSALVFLPQILILFFFIAVLEGTGYLARAAFLMDKLLGWCGLSGRAFIPLLSSFACAIPGIMAARVMPDHRSRLATILVAPLMSCSARLPVYVLLIGAVIEPQIGPAWAGFTLFAMHLLGLVVAIPVILVLNRGLIKTKRLPFLLELPPYQFPKARDVWISMWFRAKTFIQTAGTIIVLMSIIIWALLYFPRSEQDSARFAAEYTQAHPGATEEAVDQNVQGRQLENSFLGRFGKAIEPAFEPAGFDWRLSTAILSAFPAREVVVSSMGIIFNLGSEQDESSVDLRQAMMQARWPDGRPLLTPWSAVSLMVFFALCCQCMATLATVKRETGSWKWPTFMFVYMTVLAYLLSVGVYQLGLRIDSTNTLPASVSAGSTRVD